jgi:hypothetical protein
MTIGDGVIVGLVGADEKSNARPHPFPLPQERAATCDAPTTQRRAGALTGHDQSPLPNAHMRCFLVCDWPEVGWNPQVAAANRAYPRLSAGNGERGNFKTAKNRQQQALTAKASQKTGKKSPYIRLYSPLFASHGGAEVLAEAGSRTCPPPFSFPTRAERGERNVKMRKLLSKTAFENSPRKNVRLLFASCSLNF